MFRIIPRLDIKAPNLVKGVHFEGLRKLGNPSEFARDYYLQKADEIIYQDIVASLYGRNSLHQLIFETTRKVFVPVTVGGGIRTKKDAIEISKTGADKITLNTALFDNPHLISEIASELGEQAVVVNIEVKKVSSNEWFCYTESGRENTNVLLKDWISAINELGVGEYLISSIDNDGTEKGFDLDLLDFVRSATDKSILIHGGFSSPMDAHNAYLHGADGIVVSKALHYNKTTIHEIKEFLIQNGVEIRI